MPSSSDYYFRLYLVCVCVCVCVCVRAHAHTHVSHTLIPLSSSVLSSTEPEMTPHLQSTSASQPRKIGEEAESANWEEGRKEDDGGNNSIHVRVSRGRS